MSTITELFHPHQQGVRVPIWREAQLIPEWFQLRASPVFAGKTIPPGNGSAVITIPGFMCSDLYTACLTNWLARIGYRAYPSGLVRNNDCVEKLLQRLLVTIETAAAATGGKVHLIGHSLGGVMARIAALQRPERVASVVTLASPFRGIRAHSYVLWLGRRVHNRLQHVEAPHCFTGFCSCASVAALQKQFPVAVPNCAIYTKTDGIVDWQACIHENPLYNAEVSGTHIGLVFNQQVYQLLGRWLAENSERHGSLT